MPNRAVLDSDILGALLRGQNPFDRILLPAAAAALLYGDIQVLYGDIQWCCALG
eukprot:CAMPEP_0180403000 /NCGR_PEP_ID=MMETSP0989-20121125/39187_1 /TAXON_ID=697907 /ORGANISM="non described non described, Strain CCMP2293" /LENGTH=53 /DNA_ID=CAMNT_0022406197 /DNA_START=48 /DNA_END=207 /DNA_ORIENTATION=-